MMMGMVHCDDRVHGSLRRKRAWSIVITGVLDHCDGRVMEPCDDKAMEHRDGRGHGAL